MDLIPREIYQAVSPVFQSYGVPDYIWQAIGHMETGGTFDPKAVGDQGRSFGLFQLFTAGGQGDAYAGNPTVLFDPGMNARVAAPEIARAYNLGAAMGLPEGPELAAWVAANSGHPGYDLPADDPAVKSVRQAAAFYYHANTGINPANPAPGTPGGGPAQVPTNLPAAPGGDPELRPFPDWWYRLWGNQPPTALPSPAPAENEIRPLPDSFYDQWGWKNPDGSWKTPDQWATDPWIGDWYHPYDPNEPSPIDKAKEKAAVDWRTVGLWVLGGAVALILINVSLKAILQGGGADA